MTSNNYNNDITSTGMNSGRRDEFDNAGMGRSDNYGTTDTGRAGGLGGAPASYETDQFGSGAGGRENFVPGGTAFGTGTTGTTAHHTDNYGSNQAGIMGGTGRTAESFGSTGVGAGGVARDSTDTDRFGPGGATGGTHAGNHTGTHGGAGIGTGPHTGTHAGTHAGANTGHAGKPGIGDKIIGTVEKTVGKAMKDPVLVEKGQEKTTGTNVGGNTRY